MVQEVEIQVFVGYDTGRLWVYDNCIESLNKFDCQSTPIGSSVLDASIWYKERSPKDSTEFSVCRFMVPYLSDFEGWSVFMDDDFIWKVDPMELKQFCDPSKSVLVCQHDYIPKFEKKWGDLTQFKYKRKNWSSLMLFNNSHQDCKKLVPQIVNTIQPLWLHQFEWTLSIGSIPLEYNHLVGEYEDIEQAKALHYTNGYDNNQNFFGKPL